jgi:hypothetical protein
MINITAVPWMIGLPAFNDGIYSVPSKCREINFTHQGGNELPHSMERCHARKSKIHFNIFELKSSVFCTPFEVGSLVFSVRCSDCFKSCGLWPPNLTLRKLYFRIAGILPAVFIFSSCCTSPAATRDGGVPWRPLLSDRWHPAGSIYLFILLHVFRCHQGWWRSMASPLIGSLASCRHLL